MTTIKLRGEKSVETIDMTPTWTAIVPILIAGLQDGTPEGQRLAKIELYRMAEAADKWNASVPRKDPETAKA